jgi:hypothetical protein
MYRQHNPSKSPKQCTNPSYPSVFHFIPDLEMTEQMRSCKENNIYFLNDRKILIFAFFPREHSTGVKNLSCGPGEDDKRDKNVYDAGNRRTLLTIMNKRRPVKGTGA